MKVSWAERMLKRLDEPKVLAIAIAVAVVVASLGTAYAVYSIDRFFQSTLDMSNNTFSMTSNNTDWRATFEGGMPSSWTGLTNIYITVSGGTLGLVTKRVSEIASGQSYDGIRFVDLGDKGHLDNGDYFTFERSIYPFGTEVTVEAHGFGWSWSMGFGWPM